MMIEEKLICACAVCRQDVLEGQDLVDNFVYKCGELAYIELAHKECAPEWE
mgnify:CR=1 FL=1|tara:strand:+ start:229 stop:381 length:153 start_codon:yes stop_codon:yes gene_type:complete